MKERESYRYIFMFFCTINQRSKSDPEVSEVGLKNLCGREVYSKFLYQSIYYYTPSQSFELTLQAPIGS